MVHSTAVKFCLISEEKEKENKKNILFARKSIGFFEGTCSVILNIDIDESTDDTLNICEGIL